ncbi:CGNR zinc finger domain-containing protein [Saccharopolyspora sp. 5N708]|uniref:CGNR zinc finger domain-containing protein n=1 Tax=Saccharopolyspora sp. 5N708 TaxID=3457424 RepID=UPI003FD6581F
MGGRDLVIPGEERFCALALVNTRINRSNGPFDELADTPAARAWLVEHGLLASGASFDARRAELLRTFRESVRALLDARASDSTPSREDLAAVNECLHAPVLVWDVDGPRRAQRSTDDPLDAALAALAANAVDLLTGPYARSLTACGAHGCIRLFVRTHAARRWCSTGCGDRVRAARHYARRRTNADS